MATTKEFIDYVCEQIEDKYAVRYRKMFGEYMVYVNDKPILLVCDNCVYVKKIDELKNIMTGAESKAPYAGAKEHYVLDIENGDLTASVVEILEKITPLPKKKRKSNT